MVSFKDFNPAHEADLGPEINVNQDFSSSSVLSYQAEFVLTTDTYTLLQLFAFNIVEDIKFPSCRLLQQILSNKL
jgi:hypothetical protein